MSVYVVAKGEHGEGHDPLIAFATFESAESWVRANIGVTVHQVNPGRWMASENSVDETWIYQMPVNL